MEIWVLDDAGTTGDAKAVAEKLGQGRVKYFRHEIQVGSLRNFHKGISLSTGHYIHILHADDMVLPGYYKTIEDLFTEYPQCGSAFTGCWLIDEEGYYKNSVRKCSNKRGVLRNWINKLAVENWVPVPTVTVKREVYERLGTFHYVRHGEDWEMWARIAANYEVAYDPGEFAAYRQHFSNITTEYITSGKTIMDVTKVIGIINNYLPEENRDHIKQLAMKNMAKYISAESYRYYLKLGGKEQFLQHAYAAYKVYPNIVSAGYYFLMHISYPSMSRFIPKFLK